MGGGAKPLPSFPRRGGALSATGWLAATPHEQRTPHVPGLASSKTRTTWGLS